jgi:hypothetical protein
MSWPVGGKNGTIEATYAKGNIKGSVTFSENVLITVYKNSTAPNDLDTSEIYIHYSRTADTQQYDGNLTTSLNYNLTVSLDFGTTCFWSIGRSKSGSWEEDPPQTPDYCIERRHWPGLNLIIPGVAGPPFWSNQTKATVRASVIPNDFDISELDFELFVTDMIINTNTHMISDLSEWKIDKLQHGHTYHMKARSIMQEDPASKSLYSENTLDLKIDMEPPIINISGIPSFVGDELSFNIKVEDKLSGIKITSIIVSDNNKEINNVWSGDLMVRILIPSLNGTSTIRIVSQDNAGNKKIWEGQTYVDQETPVVNTSYTCQEKNKMHIAWSATDKGAGLSPRPYSLSIDGQMELNDVSQTAWVYPKEVTKKIKVEIQARDNVGNIGKKIFEGICKNKSNNISIPSYEVDSNIGAVIISTIIVCYFHKRRSD